MAIRVARGYRTVFYEAATVLERFPPMDILAEMDARIHERFRRNGETAPLVANEVRRQERRRTLGNWLARLQEPRCAQERAVGAILPSFEAWQKGRQHVIYRLT